MNAVVYSSKPNKQINGSLFYAYEYYRLLADMGEIISFIIVGANDQALIASVLDDKYEGFEPSHIVFVDRIGLMKLDMANALMVNTDTYRELKPYLGKVKRIHLYCNKPDEFVDSRMTTYGWYDYQPHDTKVRLKVYNRIHRLFIRRGKYTFVSSAYGDNDAIAEQLGLTNVLPKLDNAYYPHLFEQIDRIVYWHTGKNDANNRLVVEACLHTIPMSVYLNGHILDSIHDRMCLVADGRLSELLLDEKDEMIQMFIKDCNG